MVQIPVIAERIWVDVLIFGSTGVQLDTRTLLSLRTTNTLIAGSAKADLVFAYDPHDGSAWPYGLRAMDDIQIRGWSGSGRDTGRRVPLWTGKIDAIEVPEDVTNGRQVHITASTVYKNFEATTETADQYQQRVNWANKPASDVLTTAILACGVDPGSIALIEDGPDLHTSPLAMIGSLNPMALPGINPQYQSWANIVASVCTMSGRELFADEAGYIRYRLSHFDQGPKGTIPVERLISTDVTVDTDQGLVNEVYVYYGTPQGVGDNALHAHVGPIDGDDQAHYHRRALILPAPWLSQQADADWYAQWVLSWATHNRRPAVVAVGFWPQVALGEVYALPWPPGQQTNFYVSSVVHDIQVGGNATTVLGLAYGGTGPQWAPALAPANFGRQPATAIAGTAATPVPAPGPHWRITYYTPEGLTTYVANAQFSPAGRGIVDTPQGEYLLTSDGTQLYQQGWLPHGSTGGLTNYGSVRPVAFDPHYTIPELGNVTLSAGDQIYLMSLGVIAECHDTIGTDVALGPDTGRQLDMFYWTAPPLNDWQDFSDVRYLRVANAGIAPQTKSALSEPANAPLAPLLVPANGGTPSATRAGLAASQVAPTLGKDGNGRHNVAPTGSDLQSFVQTVIGPESGISNVQCTVFVLYILLYYGGFPGIKTGPKTIAPWPNGAGFGPYLAALGWQYVYGQSLPKPGDVVYWSPGQTTSTGVVQDLSQGAGHVAIVTAVVPPSGNRPGSVQVAQANCPQALQSFVLLPTASGPYIGGPTDGSFFGATVAGLMRYPKAT